jgi:hypothetical protein
LIKKNKNKINNSQSPKVSKRGTGLKIKNILEILYSQQPKSNDANNAHTSALENSIKNQSNIISVRQFRYVSDEPSVQVNSIQANNTISQTQESQIINIISTPLRVEETPTAENLNSTQVSSSIMVTSTSTLETVDKNSADRKISNASKRKRAKNQDINETANKRKRTSTAVNLTTSKENNENQAATKLDNLNIQNTNKENEKEADQTTKTASRSKTQAASVPWILKFDSLESKKIFLVKLN